jgi:2-polyprenyl-3-methyl-5-hydroxy-6-metoxy-1,4-benzoquinol methylase
MESPLEYRNCPNCGQDDFEVLFESNMRESDFLETVESVYMMLGGKYGRHVKCRNCHLIYVNPIEKASKINETYFQRHSVEASIIRGTRLTATESQVGLVKRYGNGTRLLDIGCGEGFFLFNASKAGYSTKGTEISQDAAEYASREFDLDVEAEPFEDLRFEQDYFDVVTLWQVLEHVPYPLVVLSKVHGILKPGGLLVTSTPDIESSIARILRRRWWNLRRIHINQFTAGTLADMVGRAGFRNVFAADYREYISLSMLVIPVLKYLRMYGRTEGFFRPGSALGGIMNRLKFAYPSSWDNCTVIGFK